jgi:hypothetical protein
VKKDKLTFGRRAFAGALGAGAAALPFLGAMRAHAGPTTPPQRFLVWFTPCGQYGPEWFPTGGETDFTLGRILEPLAAHRDRLLIFGARETDSDVRRNLGISMKATPRTPSGGHGEGMQMVLTGAPPGDFDGREWADGASVDQVAAQVLGADTRFRSLELGLRVGGVPGNGKHMCYAGAGRPLPAESDALVAYDRVFGDLTLNEAELARVVARRRRISDFVHARFSNLRPTLGAEDRLTLDAHTESIASIERRLFTPAPTTPTCTAPARTDIPPNNWDQFSNLPASLRLQIDVLTSALACDLTRVGSIQITEAATNTVYSFLNAPNGLPIEMGHHALSHEPWTNTDAMEQVVTIGRFHAENFAYLLDRLEAMPDADGSSVLDNTTILWVNEMSHGVYHTHQNMPFLVAGGGGGRLRTGRYLRVGDESHNSLLLSCLHAVGIEAPSFGGEGYEATTTIPGMLV